MKISFWNEFAVREAANMNKIRTLLSGWGGDELVSFNGGVSIDAELFWQGKVFDSLYHYYTESRKAHSPLLTFGKNVLKELILPSFSNKYFDRLYNHFSPSFYSGIDPLENMKEGFLKKTKNLTKFGLDIPLIHPKNNLRRFYG